METFLSTYLSHQDGRRRTANAWPLAAIGLSPSDKIHMRKLGPMLICLPFWFQVLVARRFSRDHRKSHLTPPLSLFCIPPIRLRRLHAVELFSSVLSLTTAIPEGLPLRLHRLASVGYPYGHYSSVQRNSRTCAYQFVKVLGRVSGLTIANTHHADHLRCCSRSPYCGGRR